MTRRTRGVLSAVVATIVAAAIPTPAPAAVSFSDAETASTASFPMTPLDLAAGGDGSVGVISTSGFLGPPVVAVRAPGGDFTAPETLTAAIGTPDLALDREGNAIVVYAEASRLAWRYRPRGGSWSSPQQLNPATSMPAVGAQPTVTFLSDGTAVAAWASMTVVPLPANSIDAVKRLPGGSFSTSVTPVAPEAATGPLTLMAGPDGRAVLSWARSDGGYRLRASRLHAGAWDAPATVGDATTPSPPLPGTFSFRPDGTLDAVWFEQAMTPDPTLPGMFLFSGYVRGATRGPASTSSWAPVRELDNSTSSMGLFAASMPDVAAGHALWSLGIGAPIQQATPVGGGFSAKSTFPTTSGALPLIEQVGSGRRVVTWVEGTTGHYAVVGTDNREEARGVLPAGAMPSAMVTDTSGRHGAIAWMVTDVSGTQTRVMSISDPAAPAQQTTPPAQAQPAPPADRQASTVDAAPPLLDRVRVSRARFRVGAQPTALGAAERKRTATGTELSWVSNEAGRVRIDVERITRGYRSSGRCLAKRPKKARGRVTRCDRLANSGTFVRPSAAGANKLKFSGRVGTRALPAGKYRFALVAVDTAGNRSPVRRASFTIVKR